MNFYLDSDGVLVSPNRELTDRERRIFTVLAEAQREIAILNGTWPRDEHARSYYPWPPMHSPLSRS